MHRIISHSVTSFKSRINTTLLQNINKVINPSLGNIRCLNLHEYQSKDLLEKYGVTVQRGRVAANALEAKKVAEEIKKIDPKAELVLKAQIHAGGRGKGRFVRDNTLNGVRICATPEEVEGLARRMIGDTLITKQTGPHGQLCQKVLVNHSITITDEKYFAFLMDRKYNGPVMIGSPKGGMDIEAVAAEDPNAILLIPIDIMQGITNEQTHKMAKFLGFPEHLISDAQHNMKGLYNLFIGTDATQVEINPFAIASDSKVYAVDAKLNFDDNASFRQKHIFSLRDKSMEDARDVRAEEAGLNYIALDGNIGCMVNGAGLAMATMDIINMNGGKPANFLDVGGGATKSQVVEAFKILVSDPNVKSILVNIFGGIMKCDIIAHGIVEAYKEVGLHVPLVIRLAGTNVEIGKQILHESKLPILTADDLDEAAKIAVKTTN